MLNHLSCGQGPRAVVLLHGFLGSGRNLLSLAQRWAASDDSLELLLPDQLGHGASPALGPLPELNMLAEALTVWLDTVVAPGKTLSIVGHSMGGRVGLLAGDKLANRLERVVTIDIAPGAFVRNASHEVDHVLDALLAAPPQADSRQSMRTFFLDQGLSPGLVDWLLMNLIRTETGLRWRVERQPLAELHQSMRQEDLWEEAEALAAKLTCIRGARSTYVSIEDFAKLKSLGARVETIEDAGHFVHMDQQQKLLDLLVDIFHV